MIYYMDGGLFETTSLTGRVVFIVAYDTTRNEFLAVPPDGNPFWNSYFAFDPPPPVPAAARKPQVGEVWMVRMGGVVLEPRMVRVVRNDKIFSLGSILGMTADGGACWLDEARFSRPATPEESEPFRPIFTGLKHSFGES